MINKTCFFNSIPFWGGGEKLHLEMAIEFSRLGYSVSLLADPRSPLWKKAEKAQLECFPVKAGNLSFLNPFKLLRLKRFFQRQNIDTVIFTTSQDLKLGSISARLAGVKRIVYLRGLAVPVKSSLVNRLVYKHCLSHIISNSDDTREKILLKLRKYIPSEKVKTIYHGIHAKAANKKTIDTLPEISEKGRGIILGNAGRLTPQKGQKYLIDIALQLKEADIEFTLFIAGTGELEPELQALILKHQLEKEVILLGFVENMEAFMNSIDIFLLSSLWEGFGFVLVEAMIKEVPVVCFKLSSNPEIISDKKTGFLVDYPDLQSFAQQVQLLIQDQELRNKMGKAARQRVFDHFILEDRVQELISYLERED